MISGGPLHMFLFLAFPGIICFFHVFQGGSVDPVARCWVGAANLRRVPITCGWCRRGCKRCSKNKGLLGENWAGQAVSGEVGDVMEHELYNSWETR